MSEEGNFDLYLSISHDFWQESSKYGYEYASVFWPEIILEVSYKDYTLASWRKYYLVQSHGSSELSEDYAGEILDGADENRWLRQSEGLSCYFPALNGTELWYWYKGIYLG